MLGHAKDSAFRETIQFLTFTGPFLAEPAKMWLLQKTGLEPEARRSGDRFRVPDLYLDFGRVCDRCSDLLARQFRTFQARGARGKDNCLRDEHISPRGGLRDRLPNLLDRRHSQVRQEAPTDWKACAFQGPGCPRHRRPIVRRPS